MLSDNTNTAPLVSVVVVTYNSEEYVLDTLNSIYSQSYENIELIISDDASKDETVKICRDWGMEYSSRFKNFKILEASVNAGVPTNCNKGVRAGIGEWLKIIAGNDALLEDCIESNIKYIRKNNAEICFSRVRYFNEKLDDECEIKEHKLIQSVFLNNILDAQRQFNSLCFNNTIAAPTIFMKRDLFDKVGGFEEWYRWCEDWPMWLKITSYGYPIHFNSYPSVKYRVRSTSISTKLLCKKDNG